MRICDKTMLPTEVIQKFKEKIARNVQDEIRAVGGEINGLELTLATDRRWYEEEYVVAWDKGEYILLRIETKHTPTDYARTHNK